MSVHLLRDGRWVVHYRLATGAQKREYFGRGPEGEASARKRNDELGLRAWKRRTPRRKSPLFTHLYQSYTSAKRGTIADTSINNLHWKMRSIVLPLVGHVEAMRMTKTRLDKYVQKRISKGVKLTTIHRELTDIQAVLNWAVEQEIIHRNPVQGYKKPKRDDEIILPPTAAETDRLLKVAKPHLVKALSLSYYLGLRPGNSELFGLKYSDCDWDNKAILVRSAKKMGPTFRIVPIHPDFYDILKSWADESTHDHIITWHGKPIKTSIKKAFISAKKEAGITRRLRLYDFRHAAISYLLRSGADLKSVSEIAGHTRTDTTTQIYQHTNIEMHREAIKRLPKLDIGKLQRFTRNLPENKE